MVDAILTHSVLPHISQALLAASTRDRAIASIRLDAVDGEFRYEYA